MSCTTTAKGDRTDCYSLAGRGGGVYAGFGSLLSSTRPNIVTVVKYSLHAHARLQDLRRLKLASFATVSPTHLICARACSAVLTGVYLILTYQWRTIYLRFILCGTVIHPRDIPLPWLLPVAVYICQRPKFFCFRKQRNIICMSPFLFCVFLSLVWTVPSR